MATELISAKLVPCPECHAVATWIDGALQGQATFFMRQGSPCMTVHEDACSWRGKATPYPAQIWGD